MTSPTVVVRRMQRPAEPEPQAAAADPPIPPTRSGKLDALNEALRAAEKHLFALDLGVSGRVEIDSGNAHDTDTGEVTGQFSTSLVWDRLGGEWRLFIQIALDGEDVVEKRILEASAEERRQAAHALPDLLLAVRSNADAEMAELDKAVQKARAFARGDFDKIPIVDCEEDR